jgi:hypothetical protein
MQKVVAHTKLYEIMIYLESQMSKEKAKKELARKRAQGAFLMRFMLKIQILKWGKNKHVRSDRKVKNALNYGTINMYNI